MVDHRAASGKPDELRRQAALLALRAFWSQALEQQPLVSTVRLDAAILVLAKHLDALEHCAAAQELRCIVQENKTTLTAH